MATDFIFFIHGVNVRNKTDYENQARRMFEAIEANISDSSRTRKPVFLFWGNVGENPTNTLLQGLEASPKWNKLWFKELRTTQVLPFVGDAALYLSRYVSSALVNQIVDQAIQQFGGSVEALKNPDEGDRLHLITHSWGTVVLFDILFASRWEDPALPEDIRQRIENIRRGFFGLGKGIEKTYGIPLASIHTMGSPIALFNLVNVDGPSSFDLTPKLKEFLEARQAKMKGPLEWKNFVHPGDPIAYPLEGVMPLLLKSAPGLVKTEDIISPTGFVGRALGGTILPLLNGGKAHSSYWTERKIAQAIGQIIQSGS